jgi:pyruvate dehydrogenase E1 component alpha subunit
MLEQWAQACPIARLRRHLEESELIDAGSDERLDAQIDAEITAAILEAEAEPPPERRTLIEDVYAEPAWNLEEQFAAFERSRG